MDNIQKVKNRMNDLEDKLELETVERKIMTIHEEMTCLKIEIETMNGKVE